MTNQSIRDALADLNELLMMKGDDDKILVLMGSERELKGKIAYSGQSINQASRVKVSHGLRTLINRIKRSGDGDQLSMQKFVREKT